RSFFVIPRPGQSAARFGVGGCVGAFTVDSPLKSSTFVSDGRPVPHRARRSRPVRGVGAAAAPLLLAAPERATAAPALLRELWRGDGWTFLCEMRPARGRLSPLFWPRFRRCPRFIPELGLQIHHVALAVDVTALEIDDRFSIGKARASHASPAALFTC